MIDTFLSGGCSFSEVPTFDSTENWPLHLQKYLNVKSIHTGLSMAGNKFISKSLIYQMSQIPDKSNLLVGVMWSGWLRGMFYNRKDLITEKEKQADFYKRVKEDKKMPLKIAGERAYYLTHPTSDFSFNRNFYENLFDEIGLIIDTLENILYVQWYLKSHNIKYFMTRFNERVLPEKHKQILNHPDVCYLYKQIDFDNWLNVYSMYDFCVQSNLPFKNPTDPHPTTDQSKLFTEQIIIPHLKNKGYI